MGLIRREYLTDRRAPFALFLTFSRRAIGCGPSIDLDQEIRRCKCVIRIRRPVRSEATCPDDDGSNCSQTSVIIPLSPSLTAMSPQFQLRAKHSNERSA